MDSRKIVWKETGIIAVGQIVCTAAMYGVFALLDRFDQTVLLGGIVGAVLAVGNFFFMAVTTSLAADKAAADDVKGGQKLVKMSYILRLAVLCVALFAFVKSGLCNVLAAVLPLAFVRPTITVAEFFRKSGEAKQ
ncbi:MAG: hypothetical protein IJ412_00580 [Oscillospiraceae bacterium]|nr:hypothetical protein [Oscillospiraceae bacterium]